MGWISLKPLHQFVSTYLGFQKNAFKHLSFSDFYLFDATNEEVPLSKGAIFSGMSKARKSQALPLRANTMRFEVPPGKYIVIPITYQFDDELKFLLRVFSEMPANLKLVSLATN